MFGQSPDTILRGPDLLNEIVVHKYFTFFVLQSSLGFEKYVISYTYQIIQNNFITLKKSLCFTYLTHFLSKHLESPIFLLSLEFSFFRMSCNWNHGAFNLVFED